MGVPKGGCPLAQGLPHAQKGSSCWFMRWGVSFQISGSVRELWVGWFRTAKSMIYDLRLKYKLPPLQGAVYIYIYILLERRQNQHTYTKHIERLVAPMFSLGGGGASDTACKQNPFSMF
jgi:hypothetical protein